MTFSRRLGATLAVLAASFGFWLGGVPAKAIPGARVASIRSAYVRLAAQAPAEVRAKEAQRLGVVSRGKTLLVSFGLPLRHERQLNWFIQHEALRGRYMSQARFNRLFAPTVRHKNLVIRWLTSHGLKLVATSSDGLVIAVRGTAQRFQSLLRVRIQRYRLGSRWVYANTTGPRLPRFLGVTTVTGLDNIRRQTYLGLRRQTARRGDVPVGGLTPANIRAAYDVKGLSVNGKPIDGTGETIGITGFGSPVPDSDFRLFAKDTGEPAICVKGCPDKLIWRQVVPKSPRDSYLDEQALDVEYIHGLAPHVRIKYWLGDDGSDVGMELAIADAAADPSVHIVSNSWGDPGRESASAHDPFVKKTADSLKRAVAVGTTFYFSTGDNAADSGCLDISTRCGLPSYPADSPYVVAVGGTNLQLNSSLNSWASETAWDLSLGDDSGSGGGCAPWFPRPSWQKGVSALASCKGRAIPDISAAADPGNSPVKVWVNGGSFPEGGTSVSATLISGLAALTERYMTLQRIPLPRGSKSHMGFAAPKIYSLALSPGYTGIFRDVLCGSNTWPAAQGWDQVTGWGSLDWHAFTEAYAGQAVTPTTPAPAWSCSPDTFSSEALTTVSCPGPYHCRLGGVGGRLLASSDGWLWHTPSRGAASTTIAGVSCPSRTVCFAVGRNGWLRKSTDGGKTFSPTKLNLGHATSISCPSRRSCVVVGDAIVTTSDGVTFARRADPVSLSLVSVSCRPSGFCVAATGNGTILRSRDTTTWQVVNGNNLPDGTIASVSCPSPNHCVAVGTSNVKNVDGGSALIYTTSDGTTWTSQVVPGDYGPLTAVSCVSSLVCDAVGGSGLVVRTIDGANWLPAQVSLPALQLNAVACPSQRLCYAVGDSPRVFQIGSSPGH